MRIIDNVTYLTIGEVAKKIGRGSQTIKNWYEWKEINGGSHLPEIHFLDKKGTRYFKESDIPVLETFRDSITYGMMADVNRDKWGVRGKVEEEEVATAVDVATIE